MSDATCKAIYGRRGEGKSTRAKQLLKAESRVVVFDVIGEYARMAGWKKATTLKDARAALRAGWRGGFRVAFVPIGDLKAQLHHLAVLLWEAQRHFETGRDRRQLTLVVEEMNTCYPATALKADHFGMQRLVLQGRHRGVNVIGLTQRPALVNADFRGNLDEAYCFALARPEDRRAVADVIGREHEAALMGLKKHEFLHWVNGDVRKGKNTLR